MCNVNKKVVILYLWMLFLCSNSLGMTLYVSPYGNDSWSGRLELPNAKRDDGPFATITGARDAIRNIRSKNKLTDPVCVLLREGTYRITKPVVFTPQDSGTLQCPITYAAYPKETPVVSGGRRITGWKNEGHLWTVYIPEVQSGDWLFHALFVDGEYRYPARSPNQGFFHTAGRLYETEAGVGQTGQEYRSFYYRGNDIQQWGNLEDVFVIVHHAWTTTHHRIAAIDAPNRIVEFTREPVWAFEKQGPNQRYYVENAFEMLDQPGEWYLNQKTGVLSYWPRNGEDMSSTEIVAPIVKQLVLFQGGKEKYVEHIMLKRLRFHHTDYSVDPEGLIRHQAAIPLSGAIHANGTRYCCLENCEISHVSNYAIRFEMACKQNRIICNHLHDIGAGGICIGAASLPLAKDDIPKNEYEQTSHNLVDNNWIHDGGKIFPEAVGIFVGRSSYNTISHNEISDLYYSGISIGWSWGYDPLTAHHHNHIEFNHVHHIGKNIMSDMAGIYLLGVSPGTIVRNNLIHDIQAYYYGAYGIYTDEGSTDILIENNVVYNTENAGFYQNAGNGNWVVNNIFAFSHRGQISKNMVEDHLMLLYERNIVYYNNGSLFWGNWDNDKYFFDLNCYWDTSGYDIVFDEGTLDDRQARGHDIQSLVADPMFEDVESFDFRLKPESPAIKKLGFRPIDLTQIGLYGSSEWCEVPAKIGRQASVLPAIPETRNVNCNFEDITVGHTPNIMKWHGYSNHSGVFVTDKIASEGSHSLLVKDFAKLEKEYHPYYYFEPFYRSGTVVCRFDVRLETGASIIHEWRDGRIKANVGPCFYIDKYGILTIAHSKQINEDGTLKVTKEPLLRIPHNEWIRMELICQLGEKATGKFTLNVEMPSSFTQCYKNLSYGDSGFDRLTWCGFIANTKSDTQMYFDNIQIELKPKASGKVRNNKTVNQGR